MSKEDKEENKASVKGMKHESGHPHTVHQDEYAGSPGGKGIRFKVHDHRDLSNVRSPEKK